MCGIAGFWRWGPSQEKQGLQTLALAMAQQLAHRGPDDAGVWSEESAQLALAHRRLAIVDLSPLGHQPMASGNHRYVIVFNGEIYNFRSLREELLALGHQFRSTGDTEVMLSAFMQWGVAAAVKRFAGMFAFALWDRQEQALHLCRDRLGKKPLYLLRTPQGLAFASELKAFSALPGFRPTLSPEGVEGFFRYGYVAENLCIFKEVIKVSPGELLTLNAQGESHSEAFWTLAGCINQPGQARISDPVEAQERLLSVLRTATQERMLADVPLGAFLSGGIDSGLVVSLMQEHAQQPTRTFSIGFEESSHDEAPVARRVAEHLGTQHTELYVSQRDALNVVERMPEVFDEPFADASQIPTTLLAALARKHVTVALTGDGGDEAFGGYVRYRSEQGAMRHLYALPIAVRRALSLALKNSPDPLWHGLTQLIPHKRRPRLIGSKVQKLARALSSVTHQERERMFLTYWDKPPLAANLLPVVRSDQAFEAAAELGLEPSERMQFWETLHYLPGDLLVKMDRATMAASLEARSPLLDHRVVELAWQLDPDLKAGPEQLKAVLRELLFKYVPKELVDLPKQGFSVPVGPWMRQELRGMVDEAIRYTQKELRDVLNCEAVEAVWQKHMQGSPGFAERLWCVVMFANWHKRWAAGFRS
ncbi:asparagine synthase (glutamine-hydrolyzing) [Paucibacter sp. AS339]|uniref:asparagine synthase (glutamine-hydrolyzing) n=1 Tax=Paucibacter hankyongi TaxID=3133434 RepID=UPI0030B65E9A